MPPAKPGRPKGGKNKKGHKAGRPRKQQQQQQQPQDSFSPEQCPSAKANFPPAGEVAPAVPVHSSSVLNTLRIFTGHLAALPLENTSEKAFVSGAAWMERFHEDHGCLEADEEGSDLDQDLVGLGTLMRELEQEGTEEDEEGSDLDQDLVGLGTLMRELEQEGTEEPTFGQSCRTNELVSPQESTEGRTFVQSCRTNDLVCPQEGTEERHSCRTNEIVSPSPTSYFSSLQERLRKEKVPKEYCQGTFWVIPEQPLPDLRNHTDLSNLYPPRVFLWLPHLLVSEPIKCSCGSRLESKGYNKDPHARRVVDVDGCFYLMTMRYRCKTCAKSLNGTDKKILEQLPVHLQMEFPAYLTHRGAVSKAVRDNKRAGVRLQKRESRGKRRIFEPAGTVNVEEHDDGQHPAYTLNVGAQDEGQHPAYDGIVAVNSI